MRSEEPSGRVPCELIVELQDSVPRHTYDIWQRLRRTQGALHGGVKECIARAMGRLVLRVDVSRERKKELFKDMISIAVFVHEALRRTWLREEPFAPDHVRKMQRNREKLERWLTAGAVRSCSTDTPSSEHQDNRHKTND